MNTAIDSFWKYTEITSTCWHWNGPTTGRGYGRFTAAKKTYTAHKFSAELHGNKIPSGLLADHICRNRLCVNPKHIRPVDNRTNSVENSVSVTAINAAKTHCINGHEFTTQNTKFRFRDGTLRRHCKICQVKYDKSYKRKIAALALARKPNLAD